MDIEAILGMFMAPIILFVLVVAPIWIILHYRSKRQMNQGLNEEERESLALLADQASVYRHWNAFWMLTLRVGGTDNECAITET